VDREAAMRQPKVKGRSDAAEKGRAIRGARRPSGGASSALADRLFLDALGEGSAAELSFERYASLLTDARFRQPANETRKVQMVSQLQQRVGNAYVQRLLGRVQSLDEGGRTVAVADEAPGKTVNEHADSESAAYEVGGSFAVFSPSAETALRPSPAVLLAPEEGRGSAKTEVSKGGGEKLYYLVVLKPMMEGLWSELHRKVLEHRHHLLALACLAKAAGPGVDPIAVSDFCKKYELPLTMPVIGLIPRLLRKVDITGAVKNGIRIMAAMGSLLRKIRLRNATLYALDKSIVPSADSGAVGMILESASSPKEVVDAAKQKAAEVMKLRADVERYAAKLKRIEAELGVGKGTSTREGK